MDFKRDMMMHWDEEAKDVAQRKNFEDELKSKTYFLLKNEGGKVMGYERSRQSNAKHLSALDKQPDRVILSSDNALHGTKANEFRTNITTKNDEADPNRLKYIELIGGSIPNRDRSLHSHQFIHTGMDLPMDIPFADFLVCVGGMQRGNRPWSRDSYRATPELIRDLQTMTFFYGKKQKNDTKQMTKFTAAEVVARPANMKDAHGRRKYRSGNKDTGPLPTEFYVKEKFTKVLLWSTNECKIKRTTYQWAVI